jgi:peroxiredoxin
MSKRIELYQPAPDFTLRDFKGQEVRLSDLQKKKNVLLIFNRGFF